MITYLKEKTFKSKHTYNKHKLLTTLIESFDTVAIIATTTNSITLSHSGVGLIVIAMSTGVACGLKFTKRVIYERVVQKHSKHKKNQKAQQTDKLFDRLYRKCLKDDLIDKKEYESLCNNFNRCLDETKINLFNETTLKTTFKKEY